MNWIFNPAMKSLWLGINYFLFFLLFLSFDSHDRYNNYLKSLKMGTVDLKRPSGL